MHKRHIAQDCLVTVIEYERKCVVNFSADVSKNYG